MDAAAADEPSLAVIEEEAEGPCSEWLVASFEWLACGSCFARCVSCCVACWGGAFCTFSFHLGAVSTDAGVSADEGCSGDECFELKFESAGDTGLNDVIWLLNLMCLRKSNLAVKTSSQACTSVWLGKRRESCDLLPMTSGMNGKSEKLMICRGKLVRKLLYLQMCPRSHCVAPRAFCMCQAYRADGSIAAQLTIHASLYEAEREAALRCSGMAGIPMQSRMHTDVALCHKAAAAERMTYMLLCT